MGLSGIGRSTWPEHFEFSRYHCFLGVAGGPGGMIIEAGRCYPPLRGIAMDLSAVCKMARELIRAAGLCERLTVQFATLFAGPYPEGADTIALSWVLHDWNDEHCRRILRRCYDALLPECALLITENVLNDVYTAACSRRPDLNFKSGSASTRPRSSDRAQAVNRQL